MGHPFFVPAASGWGLCLRSGERVFSAPFHVDIKTRIAARSRGSRLSEARKEEAGYPSASGFGGGNGAGGEGSRRRGEGPFRLCPGKRGSVAGPLRAREGREWPEGLGREGERISVCAARRGFSPAAGRSRRPGSGTSGRGRHAWLWRIRSRRGGYDEPLCCGCIF